MKKDIIEVDAERRVYQITTTDERWYSIESMNKETKLPEFKFIPSHWFRHTSRRVQKCRHLV